MQSLEDRIASCWLWPIGFYHLGTLIVKL